MKLVLPKMLKSHIQGYTRKDGTYVKPHEDNRSSHKMYFPGDKIKNIWGDKFTVVKHDAENPDHVVALEDGAKYNVTLKHSNIDHGFSKKSTEPKKTLKNSSSSELGTKKSKTESHAKSFVITEAEAKKQGYDTENVFYAGTNMKPADKLVTNRHESFAPGTTNYFGGIFSSQDYDAAASHGDNMQRFVIKNGVAESRDLDSSGASKFLKDLWKGDDLSDDEFDILYDAVVFDNEIAFDDENENLLTKVTGYTDKSEQSWAMQGIRGALARHLGFDAVEMDDEHGTSYLLVGDGVRRIADDMGKSLRVIVRQS